jgi:hypothetical protein
VNAQKPLPPNAPAKGLSKPESSLLARFEVVQGRIPALSQGKADPFHDKIVDFAPLMESSLP